MKENVISPAFNVSIEAIADIARTGRFTRSVRDTLSRRVHIDYISPEIENTQNILSRYKDRFSIVGLLDESPSERSQDTAISWTAFSLVDEGIVDKDTLVEIRPTLPDEAFFDPSMNRRREAVAKSLGHYLSEGHGIEALPSPHPILPTKSFEDTVEPSEIWRCIASELDGMTHQLDQSRKKLAMVAITTTPYAQSLFSGQNASEIDRLSANEFVTLRHIGEHPRENLLLGPRRSAILETQELRELAGTS